jgi:hypothetical protein
LDIALYADVLRRHRKTVIVGVLLTLALAFLSFVRVSPSGVAYRSAEVWSNQATLVLTQQGAPELRSVLPSRPGGFSPSLADTGRFAGLIDVYAAIATSDAVINELRRRGLVKPEDMKDGVLPIAAAAVPSTVNAATPMMTISGMSSSGPKATALTIGATKAFLDVLHRRQAAAKIPKGDRIEARVVRGSEAPKLVDPRKKAIPILVFLGGLIATMTVAFTRDSAARRGRSTALAPVVSHEASTPTTEVAEARSAPKPVPRPDSISARETADSTTSGSRSRSTLGSVPRADSATDGRDMPDEVAQLRRRG